MHRPTFRRLLPLRWSLSLLAALLSAPSHADELHAQTSLDIYRSIIAIPTVEGRGNSSAMVKYLSDQLLEAGFSKDDLDVIPVGDAHAFTARLKGAGDAQQRPILLLAHMDVVEALESDWQRPPFELTEDDQFYYGRGAIDNKYGIAMLMATFIRFKREGFVPNRDLVLVFTGDEETTMKSTERVAYDTPELQEAEFALNSDAGGGSLNEQGTPIAYGIQAAEKTYATFNLTLTNPGGHSSRPRADNAIYELSAALKALSEHRFDINTSGVTRAFFEQTGQTLDNDLGKAMVRFANDPSDADAIAELEQWPEYASLIRTTCVATQLAAGHAENALPQTASAIINCRIFPGETINAVANRLADVMNVDRAQLSLVDPYPESPTSEPREDVMRALRKAVDSVYPDVPIVPYMQAGATDGMHFRSAGIPTWGVSSAFMRAQDNFAHGLDERLPKDAFERGLDFWSILLKDLTSSPSE